MCIRDVFGAKWHSQWRNCCWHVDSMVVNAMINDQSKPVWTLIASVRPNTLTLMVLFWQWLKCFPKNSVLLNGKACVYNIWGSGIWALSEIKVSEKCVRIIHFVGSKQYYEWKYKKSLWKKVIWIKIRTFRLNVCKINHNI